MVFFTFGVLPISFHSQIPCSLPNSTLALEAPKDELEEAWSKASTENKTVIISVINKAYADQDVKEEITMLDLFLDSFWLGENTRALLPHLLVVAVDQTTSRAGERNGIISASHMTRTKSRTSQYHVTSRSNSGRKMTGSWRLAAGLVELAGSSYSTPRVTCDTANWRDDLRWRDGGPGPSDEGDSEGTPSKRPEWRGWTVARHIGIMWVILWEEVDDDHVSNKKN